MATEIWNIDIKKAIANPESFVTDAIRMLQTQNAELHHWNKYHNPTADGFMGGQFYLGMDCVNCKFSDAEKAIRERLLEGIKNDPANTLFGLSLTEIAQLIHEKKAEVSRG